MNMKRYYISALLIAAIVVIINLISDEVFFRLDFTDNKQYTLSEATKDLLKDLDKPITIKAYFSKNLPPKIANIRRDFKDLLIEYANLSKGKIKYEIINPNEDEKLETQAVQDGIQPVLVNVREKDQIKQQKAYLGAVIMMEDKKEVIPFVQPGAPLEYLLSSAIKKLTIKKKPVIALVQGQGEASINEMSQVVSQLQILYEVREFTLTDSSQIPADYKTLLIVDPADSFSTAELNILDNFIKNGGRLLVAYNRVYGNLQNMYASLNNTGLESWLAGHNIEVGKKLVVDASCGMVTVQQERGMFRFMSNVAFPYFPIATNFSKHPVSDGLEQVIFPFVSPVSYTGDSTVKYTPLVFSSDRSGLVEAPVYINIQKQWTEADFPDKKIVLAAAFEGSWNGGKPAKMVVFGDADFAINGKGQERVELGEDNVNLFVNAVDWLSDDTGLIKLRTKAVTSRPIKDLDDSTKTLLKYLNFLFPVLLIIIYGLIRAQRNKMLRIKRMGEYYK